VSGPTSPDFKALEPFIAIWGLPTLEQRRERRINSTLDELRQFHDAVIPRLEEIVAFLNQFPVDRIPEAHKTLSYMTLALCEIDDPVNKWHSVILEEALDPRRFTVKKSFYDTDAGKEGHQEKP
jgi:hypothetical protein